MLENLLISKDLLMPEAHTDVFPEIGIPISFPDPSCTICVITSHMHKLKRGVHIGDAPF